MPTLILSRKKEYSNSLRNYIIFADGVKIGEIWQGHTKSFELPAGTHSIQCKIDWCSSPVINVTLAPEETKQLEVSGFKNADRIRIASYILMVLFFLTINTVYASYFVNIALLLFLFLIYRCTFGRKNYLQLTEVQQLQVPEPGV